MFHTHALQGTALDERHTFTQEDADRLRTAQQQGLDVDVWAHCGQERAIHEADQPEQQALNLVPVDALGVATLADFLVHPGTCEVCARTVAQNTGLGWPPEGADGRVEALAESEGSAGQRGAGDGA